MEAKVTDCKVKNCPCSCHNVTELSSSHSSKTLSSALSSAAASSLRANQPVTAETSLKQQPANTATTIVTLPKDANVEVVSALPPPPPPLPPPGIGMPPPPPPPLPQMTAVRSPSQASAQRFAQQDIPSPRRKLRKLQWTKLAVDKVAAKPNFWTSMNNLINTCKISFERIEEMFSIEDSCSVGASAVGQLLDVTSSSSTSPVNDKRKKDEVNMLDNKRNLNISVFLRQFRSYKLEVIEPIRKGDCSHISAEKLRGLIKILPEKEEIDMLRSFQGNESQLGIAEKFLGDLIRIPNFRLRVDSMLIMAEFSNALDWLKPAIATVILNAKDIKESSSLKELLFLVVKVGNYLNSGVQTGDAAGISLSSLNRVADTRSNKPRVTMMHWIAQIAEESNSAILSLSTDLKYLKEAAQYSLDNLKSEVNQLSAKVKSITSNLNVVDGDFKRELTKFLKNAEEEMTLLELDVNELEEMRCHLANYFCEDERNFRLEECAKIFDDFLAKFQKAVADNRIRQLQERKAEQRRRSRDIVNKDIAQTTNDDFDRFRRPASVNERRHYRRGSESTWTKPRDASVDECRTRERSADRKGRKLDGTDGQNTNHVTDQSAQDLLSYLQQTGEESNTFDRQGSGRRRKTRESMFCGDLRERNPSPAYSMMSSAQPLQSIDINQTFDSNNVVKRRYSVDPCSHRNSAFDTDVKTQSGCNSSESFKCNQVTSTLNNDIVTSQTEVTFKQPERRKLPAQPGSKPLDVTSKEFHPTSIIRQPSDIEQLNNCTTHLSSSACVTLDTEVGHLSIVTSRTATKAESDCDKLVLTTSQNCKREMGDIRKLCDNSPVFDKFNETSPSQLQDNAVSPYDCYEPKGNENSPLHLSESSGANFIRGKNKTSRRLTIGEVVESKDPADVNESAVPLVSYSPVTVQNDSMLTEDFNGNYSHDDSQKVEMDTRRWGHIFSEVNNNTTAFKRALTLPYRWKPQFRSTDDSDSRASQTIEEEPEENNSSAQKSGKLSAVGKQKFKMLSALYSSTDDKTEVWQKRVIPTHNYTVDVVHLETQPTSNSLSVSSSSSSPPTALTSFGNPSQSKSPRFSGKSFDERSDRDSMVSYKDEGFESESISNPSVSQRTSMSSTLEMEYNSTPNLSQRDSKRLSKQDGDIDEKCQNDLYFARSIDSLVQKGETSMSKLPEMQSSLTITESLQTLPEENSMIITENAKPLRSHNSSQNSMSSLTDKHNDLHLPALPRSGLVSPLPRKYVSPTPPQPPKRTASMTPASTKDMVNNMREKRKNFTSSAASKTSTPVGKSSAPPKQTSKSPSPTQKITPPSNHHTINGTALAQSANLLRKGQQTSNGRASPKTTDRAGTPDSGTFRKAGVTSPMAAISQNSSNTPSTRLTNTPSTPLSTLIRGSPARATMPADLFRTNKKAAADARESKDCGAPTPPKRTTSMRSSTHASRNSEIIAGRQTPTSAGRKKSTDELMNPINNKRMETVQEEGKEHSTIHLIISLEKTETKSMNTLNVTVKKASKDNKKDDRLKQQQWKKPFLKSPNKLTAIEASTTTEKKLATGKSAVKSS